MIEIIPMTQIHLPAAIEIERECFSDPWSPDTLRGDVESPNSLYLAAVDSDCGGKLVGYAGIVRILDEGHIHNVAVTPEYRRMGLGSMLTGELLACARETGLCSVFLEVRQSNKAAIALYGGLGFEVSGRRPRYYQNPAEDALLMMLSL
ncbi:MAG: ribosomal protein S18-alanine N-acetyltransferase [Oscillospiraceae bacterium]|nr:ribosomal protein S18-alanine N-acetyltransferase [Oscillospiraceae bacterium]